MTESEKYIIEGEPLYASPVFVFSELLWTPVGEATHTELHELKVCYVGPFGYVQHGTVNTNSCESSAFHLLY